MDDFALLPILKPSRRRSREHKPRMNEDDISQNGGRLEVLYRMWKMVWVYSRAHISLPNRVIYKGYGSAARARNQTGYSTRSYGGNKCTIREQSHTYSAYSEGICVCTDQAVWPAQLQLLLRILALPNHSHPLRFCSGVAPNQVKDNSTFTGNNGTNAFFQLKNIPPPSFLRLDKG